MKLPPLIVSEVSVMEQGENWGIKYHNVDKVWERGFTGKGVNLWIVDTGIDPTHPDMAVKHRKSFVRESDVKNSHGTHCSSIACALSNELGVRGSAFDAYLLDAQVFPASGVGSLSTVEDAVKYIESMLGSMKGRHVVSMSLGGTQAPKSLKTVLDRLVNAHNVPVFTAAGNYGRRAASNITYPGAWDCCYVVGSIGADGKVSQFSSNGPQMQIVCAGDGIPGAIVGGGYRMMSGTSMATPLVAGVAACLIQAKPSVSVKELYAALSNTARDIETPGKDDYSGYGILNAEAALNQILSNKTNIEESLDDAIESLLALKRALKEQFNF